MLCIFNGVNNMEILIEFNDDYYAATKIELKKILNDKLELKLKMEKEIMIRYSIGYKSFDVPEISDIALIIRTNLEQFFNDYEELIIDIYKLNLLIDTL